MTRIDRVPFTVASICGLLLAAACKPAPQEPMTAEAEYQQARQQLVRAGERLMKKAGPVTDRQALARQLRLSPERFATIKTGAHVTEPIVLAFDPKKDCNAGRCTCVGDNDCNAMFAGICNNPSSGGSCDTTNEKVPVCTCEDFETPTPVEPG